MFYSVSIVLFVLLGPGRFLLSLVTEKVFHIVLFLFFSSCGGHAVGPHNRISEIF